MRGRRHRTVAVALAVGLLAATAAGAPAAGWQPTVSMPPAANAIEDVDVGLDAQGNAVAVWTLASIQWRRTQVATRPPGGAWSAPVTFQVPDERSGWNPSMAVGAAGDAAVVWSSTRLSDPDRQLTMAATRDAGGAWSEPVTLSLASASDIGVSVEPVVVVDAQGTATAMWSESTGDGRMIRTRTRPRGGAWSAPDELTPRGQERGAAAPRLAVDAQGDVTAVWIWRVFPQSGGIVQTATRPAGGAWSEPVDLSDPDRQALEPQVAVDPQGSAVAAWHTGVGVHAARRTAAGDWGPATDLAGPDGGSPRVAIDPQGTATAVWESHDDDGRLVHASTSALGGAWSAPVALAPRDDGQGWGAAPQVTTDAEGDLTAVWTGAHTGLGNRVTAARREGGGAWSAPVQLGQGSPWAAAADPQGYVTALWTQGSQTQIHTAVFDAVAPTLQTVTVPASGVVGQPVAMSVLASDLWSSVTAGWAFGDGGTAVGASVARCYSTPGTRTVTVTGTDAAGNAANAQRTVSIAADPALAPGVDPCAQQPDPPDPPGPPNLPGPPNPPDPPGPGDPPNPPGDEPATAPRVSALQQTAARWRTRAVDRRPRLPVGTTFRFRLDRAADVRLAFTQTVTGRRVAARCVKATKANRGKPRCRSSKPRGTLRLSGATGANAYAFRGRIGSRTLAPGRYRLHVTALDDGGTSAAATIAFTVAG